jgi:dienelactone hydrolase/predicted GH43/DUF377 family glycosyl hydrolase
VRTSESPTAVVVLAGILACLAFSTQPANATPPAELRPWLQSPQTWARDTDGPIVSLGQSGDFDDTHLFAPAVALENEVYQLWYCGSRGDVAQRVFQMGLATSQDGRTFEKHAANPVYQFGDGKHSILTPTLLRNPDGTTLRENGRLRMWFSSTWFEGDSDLHTLHETTSENGIQWTEPSPVQLKNAYAPTVIKTGSTYQMWYTDVGAETWIIRHASSQNGTKWRVTAEPSIVVDQPWERDRLFYPTVMQIDGIYLMWYGSYWSGRPNTTALGFAVSLDGLKWYKHAANPVLRPDPDRPWESHYVTSQSIMRLPDGSFRMWYASRKAPPFVNKYFALGTAVWKKPAGAPEEGERLLPDGVTDAESFACWQAKARGQLCEMLGIPTKRVPLEPEKRGEFEWDGIVVEKWVIMSEPGSRMPGVLYRPKTPTGPMPAIVLTFGHGGSKGQWQYSFAGQLFARLGLACLAMDPIGEEERHREGKLGTRAHDPKSVSDRADRAGRLIMGKLVFDTMRGIDFLETRDDIDHDRIGVAGNSLGGAKASWMAAVEPRIKMALVSGWAYDDDVLRSKYCTKLPNQRMREHLTWAELALLAAPNCDLTIMNGDADEIIDKDGDGSAWVGTRNVGRRVEQMCRQLDIKPNLRVWFEAGAGHRPFFIYREALEWIHAHLGTPSMTLEQIRNLPTINSGDWCDANGIRLEKLYGTPMHQRGATLPDLGLRPIPREKMSVLKPGELGSPEFTIEGWLEQIERP